MLALVLSLVQTLGPGTVDWTRGIVRASGGAAPSLRAPGPQVARISAERAARRAAGRRLYEALLKLPLLAGGTVGKRVAADAQVKTRLGRLADEPAIAAVRYASDGGVEVDAELALDRVAEALVGAAEPEGEAAGPGRARIVAVSGRAEPALVPGGHVRYCSSLGEARKEADASARVVRAARLRSAELRGGLVYVVLGSP